jgi:hypothetical protein
MNGKERPNVMPAEMVAALEDYVGKKFPPAQLDMLVKKLGHFKPAQLGALYERTIEDCKYLFARGANPVAQIFDVARDLGFFSVKPHQSAGFHNWTPTKCRLCGGQGLIVVFFDVTHDGEGQVCKTVTRIFRASCEEVLDWKYEHRDQYDSIARCSCERGDVPTLERGIPKWGGQERGQRSETFEQEEIPF